MRLRVWAQAPGIITFTTRMATDASGGIRVATIHQAIDVTVRACATSHESFQARRTDAQGRELEGPVPDLIEEAVTALAQAHGVGAHADVLLTRDWPTDDLGGPAVDAAAALMACQGLWGLELTPEDLMGVAQEVDPRIGITLVGQTSMRASEQAEPTRVLARGQLCWVVIGCEPEFTGVQLREQWQAGKRLTTVNDVGLPTALMHGLINSHQELIGHHLHNDLWRAATSLNSGLSDLAMELDRTEALGVVLSGEEPVMLALAPTPSAAGRIVQQIHHHRVVRYAEVFNGGVPGAHTSHVELLSSSGDDL